MGTVYQNTSNVLGREVDTTYTVIEFEPSRMLRRRGETSSTSVDTIGIDDTDAGARVHYNADVSMNGVAKLVEPLLPLGLKKLGGCWREATSVNASRRCKPPTVEQSPCPVGIAWSAWGTCMSMTTPSEPDSPEIPTVEPVPESDPLDPDPTHDPESEPAPSGNPVDPEPDPQS